MFLISIYINLTPAIGTPASAPLIILPYTSAELRISGNTLLGMSKKLETENKYRKSNKCWWVGKMFLKYLETSLFQYLGAFSA